MLQHGKLGLGDFVQRKWVKVADAPKLRGYTSPVETTHLPKIEAAPQLRKQVTPPPVVARAVQSSSKGVHGNQFLVTTCDIAAPYTIVGPVYFSLSNKGIFSSQLSKLKEKYKSELAELRNRKQLGKASLYWGFLYGEMSVGQSDFDRAFFISVQEIKKRAKSLGATAVIGLRQDIDLDTNYFQFFYMQMYGTAVVQT